MKRKGVLITVGLILVFILGTLGFMAIRGYGFTVGKFYREGDTTFVIENNSAMIISDRSNQREMFEKLNNGDEILVVHGGVEECYPSRTGAYYVMRLSEGDENYNPPGEVLGVVWQNAEHSFIATVVEMNGDSVVVEPVPGEEELRSGNRLSFRSQGMDIGAEVGSTVKIKYSGNIMETYPAKIDVIEWEVTKDLRYMEYTEIWVDKEKVKKAEEKQTDDLYIAAIYENCFFANHVIPMPHTIKINGSLSEDWCVGDKVRVTYQDVFHDNQSHRTEGDLVTIESSTFEPEPGVCYKPVIYLYPEKEMDVQVELLTDGGLTCTYPKYENGWQVIASPDGTLTDDKGQKYNYLYWEGETHAKWDMSKGFCIKGEDTAEFLETALEKLGLNRREANEFIVYWLPLMEVNAYNIISFQADVYTDAAKLEVKPSPDTLIRVFMTWQASETYVEMEEQKLETPERHGFTVIEWGGAMVK